MTRGVAEGAVNNSTGHLVKGRQCQPIIRSGCLFQFSLERNKHFLNVSNKEICQVGEPPTQMQYNWSYKY